MLKYILSLFGIVLFSVIIAFSIIQIEQMPRESDNYKYKIIYNNPSTYTYTNDIRQKDGYISTCSGKVYSAYSIKYNYRYKGNK